MRRAVRCNDLDLMVNMYMGRTSNLSSFKAEASARLHRFEEKDDIYHDAAAYTLCAN